MVAGQLFNCIVMDELLLQQKAAKVKLVITDIDGVWTDNGVYYGEHGEVMKRFSIRDGMGVERLKNIGIETGIITGETSPSVRTRAAKLKITELHLGIKDKASLFKQILEAKKLTAGEVAYIGDDVNDLGIMTLIGFTACPADAMPQVARRVDYICKNNGGHGAFRELAEYIIAAQQQ